MFERSVYGFRQIAQHGFRQWTVIEDRTSVTLCINACLSLDLCVSVCQCVRVCVCVCVCEWEGGKVMVNEIEEVKGCGNMMKKRKEEDNLSYTHIHTCRQTDRQRICTCVCTETNALVCTQELCACTCTHTRTFSHPNTHTHSYISTHIQSNILVV